MSLIVLLLAPLAGAALLGRATGAAARTLHAAALAATLGAAAAVVVGVASAGTVTALDGLLRADALSAWMVGLIGIVAALAGAETLAGFGGAAGESRRFYPLFHLFVFTMLLAVTTDDLGLMWVAVEGTTLASVFLVNFHRTRASLEAAYKYLLICSVGIALAFVGTVFIYFADAQRIGAETHALRWTTLVRWAPQLPPAVVELAFVFLSSATAPRPGSPPCTPGSPTLTARRPRRSARSCPACC
jgi:hydrogenase-4 component F